ncbi:MAG: Ig-like domain-containing protein [Planctomycetaceae bacterium]
MTNNKNKKPAALNPKTLEPRILLSATALDADVDDEALVVDEVEINEAVDAIVEGPSEDAGPDLFSEGEGAYASLDVDEDTGSGEDGETPDDFGITTGEGRYADSEDIDDVTVDEDGRTRLYSVGRGLVMDLEKDIEIPNNYSVEFEVEAASTEAGSNFFYIFDYVDKRNFKYAGARAEADDWVIGERVEGRWNDLAKLPVDSIDEDAPTSIEIKVLRGREVCLFEDGELQVVHEFDEKFDSDVFGVANRNADSFFENMTITDGSDEIIYGEGAADDPNADIPSVSEVDGRTRLFSDGRGLVIDLDESLEVSEAYTVDFDFETVSGRKGANVFYIFDYVDEKNFKYAGSRTQCDDWVIGERKEGRWTDYAHIAVDDIAEDQLTNLNVVVDGSNVCVVFDGDVAAEHDFGEAFTSELAGFGNRHAETFISNVSLTDGGKGGENGIPDATDDKVETAYATTVGGNVLDNDADPDGDQLTVSLETGPSNGNLVLYADGTYEYTPNEGFSGQDTFTYTIDDGNGGTDVAEVCIEVGEKPNEGPDAVKDKFETEYGATVSDSVVGNDSDPDGDELTVTLVSGPGNGTLVLNPDGTFDYTPNDGFSGDDTFEYQIDDGNGGTDIAEVCVTVGEKPNEGPDAQDDKVETAYATTIGGNVLDNDADPDGDQLTVALETGPSNGNVVLYADGTYEYTPNEGFSGQDTFTYTVDDGNGGTDVAEVCIEVGEKPNEGPDAADDKADTPFNTAFDGNVLDNDTDPDGDDLTVTLVTPPEFGTLSLNADGTFKYTPNDGFSGEDTFEYQVDDGRGGTDTAEVCITVGEKPNEGPNAQDDKVETAYATTVGGNVLDNDADPDGDELFVTLDEGPSNGNLVLYADGTYEYTPNEGFSGQDTFTYTVDDGNGGTDVAEVCITVGEKPNEGPDAVKDKFQTNYGETVSDSVVGNDSDPDGDDLTVTLVSEPGNGTLVLNPDGTFDYTPNDGFSGDDTFEYQIDDGNGGTDIAEVCITVGEKPNEGPDAKNDKVETAYQTVVDGNVLDNDVDPDGDHLTVKLLSEPENGSVTLNPDGSFEYLPANGFSGVDIFEYQIDDGNGGTDTAEVCITVAPKPNEGPDAIDDKVETDYESAVEGNALGNDVDPDGDTLKAKLVTQPANGSVILEADGSFVYTPKPGFSGTDVFEYEVSDGNGGTDIAEVCITVGEKPNEGPDAVKDKFETDFGATVSDSVVGNDSDPDGDDLTVTLVSGPSNGTLILNPDGTFDYTPNNGFSGDDTFEYQVDDGNGGTDIAEVCITVGEKPNVDPDAVDDKVQTDYNSPATGNVLDNDSDADGDSLTVTLESAPSNGTLVLNPDGTYEYTPNDGFSGLDTFTYTVDDGEGGTDTAEVCIEVGEEPVPEPEKVFTYDVIEPPGSENGGDIQRVTTTFNETTNEFSFKMVIDGDTDGFTLAINDGPNPKGNGDEMALFYFDNSGREPVVTAYNYNGENNFSSFQDTPLASSLNGDSPFSGIEVTTDKAGNKVFCFTMDATELQSHSDGEAWTGVAFDEKIGMWLHPMEGLQTNYGADGYLDSWNFDSQGWFDTANQDADCELVEANDAVASADSFVVGEGESVSGDVLDNDTDPNGDDLVVAAVNGDTASVGSPVDGSNGGTFTIDADGSLTFDSGSDFDDLNDGETRLTTIKYTVDDGNGGTDTTTVTVCVSGDTDTEPVVVADQKMIVSGAYNHGEGREVTFDLSHSVLDGDGDNLTYKLNFADSFFVDGQDEERGGADAPGSFGWEVKSFDPDTGLLTMQIYTEKGEAWHYDGHKAAPDVFIQATEDYSGANWSSGSAYQPFSFSVCDEDGNELETSFGLQVFDVDYNSPIALDLDGSGEIETTGEHTAKDSFRSEVGETVQFDIDADGVMDEIEWFAGSGDGILVDTTLIGPNGEIDGSALFGDLGGQFEHGYEALAEHDVNADGQISGEEMDNLAVWVDDGDAILEEGELQSLADNNIASISTEMELDEQGRMRSTATTTDGSELMTEDVWFAERERAQAEADANLSQQIQNRIARLREKLLGDD